VHCLRLTCRVSWAALELRSGNLADCRQLLREGLDQHPDCAAALLLLSQIERRWGRIDIAEAYTRRAQQVGSWGLCQLNCSL
jgi:Tfp pilus assembly protein PilF